ncbi:hypothetical protein ACXN5S_12565 [Pseudoroseicyclus sp. H15]
MFKIVKEPQFTHKVTVKVPVDGGHESQTMMVRYRYVPDAELSQIYADNPANGDSEMARAVTVSLDDLAGEDGQKLDCTPEVMEQVFSKTYARAAIIAGYVAAVSKAAAGN